jgi:hypothetical protein
MLAAYLTGASQMKAQGNKLFNQKKYTVQISMYLTYAKKRKQEMYIIGP